MSVQRRQPDNDHDLLVRIWTVLEGTNGDGLVTKFEEFSKETANEFTSIKAQIPFFWTREQHEEFEKHHLVEEEKLKKEEDANRNRRHMGTRDWLLVAGAFMAPIVTVIGFFFAWGKP